MAKTLNKIKERWFYIVILIISVGAILPLLRSDFYHFSDEPHIANLYQMIRGFQSGQFPPRWAPDMSFGYGYPLFNFYYPLPFYIGSLFFVFTNSLVQSLKLVFLITIPLSGVGMFLWLRQHTDKVNSLVGSIIYIYTPYRAVDLYVRGAIGESLAFVIFPIVAFAGYKTLTSKTTNWIGFFALVVGIFILSHNLAPIFFIPWLLIYLFILTWTKGLKRGLVASIAAIFLGAGLSSFWWLPAIFEKNLLVSSTPFNYIDHFPFIKQLILPSWGYGASLPGINDDISFQVGIVNILLIALITFFTLKTLKSKKSLKILPLFFLGSIAAFLFLMNIRSSFLWEITQLSAYIQFPWRLLMMTTFLTSSLVIFVKAESVLFKKLLILLGVLSVVLTIGYFKPSEYFSPDDDYFLKRFFANRTIDGQRESFSEDYLNYSEDYLLLPLWVKERPSSLPRNKITVKDVEVAVVELSPVHYKAEVNLEESRLVEVNLYNFPGWEVRLDSEIVVPETLSPYGNIGVNVEKGRHDIEVKWTTTNLRKLSNYISLVSLILITILILFGKKRGYE